MFFPAYSHSIPARAGFNRKGLLMAKENSRIPAQINCIRTQEMSATLISTQGSHCEVWETAGTFVRQNVRYYIDFVLKKPLTPYPEQEVKAFNREYLLLKKYLDDIIPNALFVTCEIDGQASMVVLARTVRAWFNIANPGNEEEAIELLRKLPKARRQLITFLDAAERWHENDGKVIDLFGLDNLVLDKDHNIRYIDSFGVFFYEDLLYILDTPDPDLKLQIDISIRRRNYLRQILQLAQT